AIDFMPHQVRTEQLKAVMASVSDGIIAIDHEGRVTQYNPAAEKIIRIPAQEVIGKPIFDTFPPDIPLLDALKTGAVYNNREILLDRTKSHYLTSGRPIFDQRGRIIGAVAILKDISDVRALVYTVTGQLPLTFDQILFASSSMQRVVALAKTIARGDSTILIRGETGTGKEIFARALHAASSRAEKTFVPINCSAIPDTLMESELFGYEKGAFTGAVKGGKQGLFEFADGGSLFLDEIGELSPHLQAKLLRVLQDGKVRRIGGTREMPVNVRILAATHRNLEDLLQKGWFREDLYYRLNVIPLFLPPLRARKEDIPLLTQAFLKRFAARLQKPVQTVSETALRKLGEYHWPGNIRELENVIERAVNIITGEVILAEHIILDQDFRPKAEAPPLDRTRPLEEIVAEAERIALAQAMQKYPTSRKLGSALGLSHTAVLKKIRKYALQPPKK
ncbi:MAG: sigma 54-interacting transcriptional regulator, partial [Deltaproteobacteria bacterium]|nr:sigma 54-interacting transcriptional regulator [Deltaproteobacteria bacterium]